MGSSKNPVLNEGGHQYSVLKKLLYPLYALFPILIIHFYFNPFSFSPPTNQIPSSNRIIITPQEVPTNNSRRETETPCDYANGEWVPTNLQPLYNGTTCDTIKPGQNCILFGRPDKNYLHYKWQPNHCKLRRFDPTTFLKLLENRHVAFVGDSLARNQLESLLCMLSAVEKPSLYYTDGEENKFRKWWFPSHNINVSIYWSPFLVKGVEKTSEYEFNTLFLDRVNEVWAADVRDMDLLVLSAGHWYRKIMRRLYRATYDYVLKTNWYLNPGVYHYNNTILGCHLCQNYTEIGFYDVYGKALKTAFKSIVERAKNNLTVFLTTFSPAHFEGEWDKLGACSKTTPYKEAEQVLEGMNEEMRRVGVEKVREAQIRAKEFGNINDVRFEALDITKVALMRPDGHPGPYMNPYPFANGVSERVPNDCVHWCLPGPIDAWNEILMDLVRRSWGGEYKEKR